MSFLKESFSHSVGENTLTALSDYQRSSMKRLSLTIQMEQQSYLSQHPEISAMLIPLLSRFVQQPPEREDVLKEAALYFLTKSEAEMRKEIWEKVKIPVCRRLPVVDKPILTKKKYEDISPRADLIKHFITQFKDSTDSITSETVSSNSATSSFMSIKTSESTLQSQKDVLIPEPSISEVFTNLITKMIDKAVYSQVTEWLILYDIAYVELMNVVENAMEIPVIEVRKDIVDILNIAYRIFELKIEENKRLAEEATWENRIKKKIKRRLRRQCNYKGYDTPRTFDARESSTKSPKVQYNYNRYPKDQFGVYLPRVPAFSSESVTVLTGIDDVPEYDQDMISMKSVATKYSFASLALAINPLTTLLKNAKKTSKLKSVDDNISEDLKHTTHVLFKP